MMNYVLENSDIAVHLWLETGNTLQKASRYIHFSNHLFFEEQ